MTQIGTPGLDHAYKVAFVKSATLSSCVTGVLWWGGLPGFVWMNGYANTFVVCHFLNGSVAWDYQIDIPGKYI